MAKHEGLQSLLLMHTTQHCVHVTRYTIDTLSGVVYDAAYLSVVDLLYHTC
jgi:hypothetical protein